MIRYFAAHPTAANILMFIIVLLGITALPELNKETFPEIKLYKVQVTVNYPGASAAEVEEGICNRLEDATDGISFLDERSCEARDNVGIMVLDMQETGNLQQFIDDINSAVDSITDFPGDAEEPLIDELGRVSAVVSVAISADLSQPELKALAEYYRDRLLALPQVPMVDVSGFSTHEYSVRVKAETLRRYRLSIEDIANLVRQQAVDLPAGILEADQRSYQIRVENERRSVEELADLVVLNDARGGRLTLGDIATISDEFTDEEVRVELDGRPAALLQVKKNSGDDTLTVFNAVQDFVDAENAVLPANTRLVITQDSASIVKDRLQLLIRNGWQGLLLATLALFLFFSWRYTFWVALGLPISFIGGLMLMSLFGISINMISMVALLMAIGILMDDAIVISESIENEFKAGRSPLQAAVSGIEKVGRGVLSSFATSALLFGSLLFLKGDMGQVMGVLPVVLLSVLTVSLVEAFLILPHHLVHSLQHHRQQTKPRWREGFEQGFENLRERIGRVADLAIRYRYLTVGIAIGLFIVTVSLFPAGLIKFKAFPDLEGNVLEARIIMPQGTPFDRTEAMVARLIASLREAERQLPPEDEGELIRHIQVFYSNNADAGEQGAHLATISLDLLDSERRRTSLNELRRRWFETTGSPSEAVSIQFKEPQLGPAGQAISIRLQHDDLWQLSNASWELQTWLNGYPGVSNVMDDLRLGKPQFTVSLLPGALASGLNAQQLAQQLRAAYQGIKIDDVYRGREAYEINIRLDTDRENALQDFEQLSLFNNQGIDIPLSAIAAVAEKRGFSRIMRINHQRTATITGDIDAGIANTNEIIGDTRDRFLNGLQQRYPGMFISLEGEVKNSQETNLSVLTGFVLGIFGVYFLLSFQFRNYREPFVVLMNIPLALIGVIWGHKLMGLDITLPSMIGFVSLAGVVVNDSILLVEFVKRRSLEGMTLHDAAGQAVRDRFRAIFLTSITTIAGMLPLLSETSLQAQVLIPLVASVVFGMVSSTILLLLVLPAAYAIMEDLGIREIDEDEMEFMRRAEA
ncbi:MAG: efflux RND transporter permease subunit [Gammaproteobacteria bacterium]|nr:efflux RND transporter permease subunit [Gammaproteobacteria bacterium]MDH3447547.1 efflux RND transporter permease subunit [Gammaproteobacteria bacterium]